MNTAIELLTRILCDTRPEGAADGAYLYCTTLDNQPAVFNTAKRLISQSVASRIYVSAAPAMSGYPGVAQCRQELHKFGLTKEQIGCVPIRKGAALNTLVESEALIQFARDEGFGSLVVVSPPFHQLRAFMTAVTVTLKRYPKLAIYSAPGASLAWMQAVAHSQGTLQAPRRQLIQEELARIYTYQDKGDLARFEAVLDYLNHRDVDSSSGLAPKPVADRNPKKNRR
jgi:uncharacterized SAM-binding protein YcdF (DUF218 family)